MTATGLRAEVIAVGTELVQGLICDTNSAWISERLSAIGVPTDYHTCVADDATRLEELVKQASTRSDLVLITGGLGPTADDITREIVARAAGVELVLHQPSLDEISARFAKWHREMSDNNRSQAALPEGAQVMPNANGTAPGFVITIGRARVFVFPGVPAELHVMFETEAVPRIREVAGAAGVIRVRRIYCFGPGESSVDQKIRHLMSPGRNPNVGLLVSGYVITVKITATADTPGEAGELIAGTESEVRGILGEIIFGADGETMEEAAARELLSRSLTIALAESCTGGLIARRLTNVSGISGSFLAGIVSYADEAKRDFLDVPGALIAEHGAVSEPVARAMAEGVRKRTGADVAVSTTGIAGPTGGTPGKPVGLIYIALADADGIDVRECHYHGSRSRIRVRSAMTALDMIRRWAMKQDIPSPSQGEG